MEGVRPSHLVTETAVGAAVSRTSERFLAMLTVPRPSSAIFFTMLFVVMIVTLSLRTGVLGAEEDSDSGALVLWQFDSGG